MHACAMNFDALRQINRALNAPSFLLRGHRARIQNSRRDMCAAASHFPMPHSGPVSAARFSRNAQNSWHRRARRMHARDAADSRASRVRLCSATSIARGLLTVAVDAARGTVGSASDNRKKCENHGSFWRSSRSRTQFLRQFIFRPYLFCYAPTSE